MSKHTQGEYYVIQQGSDFLICVDGKHGRMELATVHGSSEYGGKLPAEANAVLFAASPDLLDVTVEALEYYCATKQCLCDEWGPKGKKCLMCRMRAAIKKAKGK